MSVYVDRVFATTPGRRWPFTQACHMFADTEAELHHLAGVIGLRRSWFQPKKGLPHYDLTAGRRRAAVRQGAIEVTRRQAAEWTRKRAMV